MNVCVQLACQGAVRCSAWARAGHCVNTPGFPLETVPQSHSTVTGDMGYNVTLETSVT